MAIKNRKYARPYMKGFFNTTPLCWHHSKTYTVVTTEPTNEPCSECAQPEEVEDLDDTAPGVWGGK
jgi:hypothetical protein